ncbi:protein arginine N-methyltransferase 1 [Drosophila obscura]|uniref:protein arginine N-methyltransferase 1 n=1 Tax=Drosophila obscura TaxID=7282 RepID=UPI001BB177EA|nr:protein arginine N-methyltransferase 1 [Drosophila obscura]
MKFNIVPVEELNLLELSQIEMGFEWMPEEQIDDVVSVSNEDYLDENLSYFGSDEDVTPEQYPDGLSEDNNVSETQEQQDETGDLVMDRSTADALGKFIRSNLDLFVNKIVLDVGCYCGVLSQHCIQAGAALVLATGNGNAAKYVMANAIAHGMGEVFVPIRGSIAEIELPFGIENVDVIVSEWMGHSVFVGSRFKDVLYARDKWLVEGGLIFPNVGKLYITGLFDNPIKYTETYLADTIEDSRDYPTHTSGSDSEEGGEYIVRKPSMLEAHVCPVDVITQKYLLQTIDLYTAVDAAESFTRDFKLRILKDGLVLAVALHCEICVALPNRKLRRLFSTGPRHPETYLNQTVLLLETPNTVAKDMLLKGVFGLYRNQRRHGEVEYSLRLKGGHFDPYFEPQKDPRAAEDDFFTANDSLALLFGEGEEPMAELNSEVDTDSGTDSGTGTGPYLYYSFA